MDSPRRNASRLSEGDIMHIKNGVGRALVVICILGALAMFGRFLPGQSTGMTSEASIPMGTSLPYRFVECRHGPNVIYLPGIHGNSVIGYCGHVTVSGVKSDIHEELTLQWSSDPDGPWQSTGSSGGTCQDQASCGGAAGTMPKRGYYRVRQVALVGCSLPCKVKPTREVRYSKTIFIPRTNPYLRLVEHV